MCPSPLSFATPELPQCYRMCPNVPECARMCLCYGLECAAGLGLPVNAFCVSHVLEGVTFCWWTSTRTYMFIPLLWSEPIAGSAPTTAHMSSGTSASHTRPKSHASIMGAWRVRNTPEKTDLFIFPCWPIDHPGKIKNFIFPISTIVW